MKNLLFTALLPIALHAQTIKPTAAASLGWSSAFIMCGQIDFGVDISPDFLPGYIVAATDFRAIFDGVTAAGVRAGYRVTLHPDRVRFDENVTFMVGAYNQWYQVHGIKQTAVKPGFGLRYVGNTFGMVDAFFAQGVVQVTIGVYLRRD